jgi:hypothetical protein
MTNKSGLLIAVGVIAFFDCNNGWAQDREANATPAILERVYACSAIEDDQARLACFDQAVPVLRTAQSGGQIVALDTANVQELQQQSFGFSLPAIDNILPRFGNHAERVENIEATVESMRVLNSGHTLFSLSNGQVWTQVDTARVRNVRAGDAIRVQRASLGSFMLISPRGGMGIRVRRND